MKQSYYIKGIFWILLFLLISIEDSISVIISQTKSEVSTCTSPIIPDIELVNSNEDIEANIKSILKKYEDTYLGTSAPSTSQLNNAITQYNKLNISVANGEISGNTVSSYNSVSFLKVFAQHLRYHSDDATIREKANNIVWLVSKQICDGSLKVDGNGYSYRNFARPAAVLSGMLDVKIDKLFEYALYKHGAFGHFWEPEYNEAYQLSKGGINTDVMYNQGDVLLAFCAYRHSADERYRWMKGFKRWVERFTSYTFGTADGVKIDGTGFHHWTAYDGYMYSFTTACDVIYYLAGSVFQIEKENYLFFRNAIYAQIVLGNESGVKALSMVGRNPQGRGISYGSSHVKRLALAGGQILGLSTADPVLAGEYNRIWGVSADLNFNTVTPLAQSSGYYQFNHSNAGVFRKNQWLAVMKGFTNGLWGAELYTTSNRYGRYQSYGTLEIIYNGDIKGGNGYDVETWNWNYNPGATTIVLPWDKLHGEKGRIDEYQKYDFAGALSFKNKGSETLNRTHGAVGVFAMDFQEKEGQGWSTVFGSNAHNATFKFKKSTFAFDDMIVCLGSNINNNDLQNTTVTTLFQRLDNKGIDLWANGKSQRRTATFGGSADNWVFSNYKTGFYMVGGNNDTKVWNGYQQTPNQNQNDPSAFTKNASAKYWIGYIDHGFSPVDAAYEFIVIPEATTAKMIELDDAIQSGNKPYIIHQKNAEAHILEHNSGVWGYAVFSANTNLSENGLIMTSNTPCLIMYEEDLENNTLKLALTNPALGFSPRSYKAADETTVSLTLKGKWIIDDENNFEIRQSDSGLNTRLHFFTQDGLPQEIKLRKDIANSMDNQIEGKNYRVYPNPSSESFNIVGDFPDNSIWNITNTSGVKINEGKIKKQNTKIKASSLSSGIYVLNVLCDNKVLFTEKIMATQSL